MHAEWQSQLPFYVAGTLSDSARRAVESHLDGCQTCRVELREWRVVAAAVRAEAAARATALPALSPVVRANLRRRPTTREALRSATHLISAQWPVLRGLLPGALLVLALAVLGTIALRDDTQAALPLLALTPIVGALSVAFLHHTEVDPAWEIVAAAPTSTGALVFARLTLTLGLIVGLMLAGSLAVSIATAEMLAPLVAAWLGPLLLLSALATLLAVRWTPTIGAGVSLALWVTVVSMLVAELRDAPLVAVSLRPLLDPGAALVSGQLIVAGLLWWLGWRLACFQPALRERAS